MAAILSEDQRQHHQQTRRTMYVKPWLSRHVTLGHYDTLMRSTEDEDNDCESSSCSDDSDSDSDKE